MWLPSWSPWLLVLKLRWSGTSFQWMTGGHLPPISSPAEGALKQGCGQMASLTSRSAASSLPWTGLKKEYKTYNIPIRICHIIGKNSQCMIASHGLQLVQTRASSTNAWRIDQNPMTWQDLAGRQTWMCIKTHTEHHRRCIWYTFANLPTQYFCRATGLQVWPCWASCIIWYLGSQISSFHGKECRRFSTQKVFWRSFDLIAISMGKWRPPNL